MKIEKINENQIRCTLTREDLESHQIRISELAYGTEKAKKLFRDMMQQAQIQFGFEADNIPLMIEAIPINAESIILIITKVEDPEELDTRFSKFAPFKGSNSMNDIQFDGADSILDIFKNLCESKLKNMPDKKSTEKKSESSEKPSETETENADVSLIRLYEFVSLDDVINAAKSLGGFFQEDNALYRESADQHYKLVIHQNSCSPEDFNKVCNILSEYGRGRAFNLSGEAHLREHGELISQNALQQLMQL